MKENSPPVFSEMAVWPIISTTAINTTPPHTQTSSDTLGGIVLYGTCLACRFIPVGANFLLN